MTRSANAESAGDRYVTKRRKPLHLDSRLHTQLSWQSRRLSIRQQISSHADCPAHGLVCGSVLVLTHSSHLSALVTHSHTLPHALSGVQDQALHSYLSGNICSAGSCSATCCAATGSAAGGENVSKNCRALRSSARRLHGHQPFSLAIRSQICTCLTAVGTRMQLCACMAAMMCNAAGLQVLCIFKDMYLSPTSNKPSHGGAMLSVGESCISWETQSTCKPAAGMCWHAVTVSTMLTKRCSRRPFCQPSASDFHYFTL